MASTYTTNLGIEKPGTGEQSGTWGTTANTNYDLIDQAINGIVQVTLAAAGSSGSPNTIDITNGTASDGRNKYIEFVDGGDLGATAYVQLDPNDAEKIVHMRNSLSGSRSVIVFQGTYNASNDFEIPAGKDVVLKFDGGGASATVTQVFVDLKLDALDAATVAATTGNITTVNATTVDTTNLEVTNLKAKDGTSAGSIADSTGVVTIASAVLTTADINGGTMDGVTIGGASTAAGSFTTVTASGRVTFGELKGTGATVVNTILDEDNMATNSDTALATQQSIKAYVDSQVGTVDTLAEILANGNTSGANNLIITAGQSLTTDSILETSANNGVNIDSVVLKDGDVNGTIGATTAKAANFTTVGASSNVTVGGTLGVTGATTLSSSLSVNTGAVFNEGGGDNDFRVESDTNEYALFVQGSDGNVGIGRVPSSVLLDVQGSTSDTFTAARLRNAGTDAASAVKQIWSLNRTVSDIDFEAGSISVHKTQEWTSTASTVDSYMAFNTIANENVAERFRIAHSEIVSNENGLDQDFRVESDTNTHMLYVDAGNNHVNIGTSSDLGQTLNVDGGLALGADANFTWTSNYLKFQTRSASVPVVEFLASASGNFAPRIDLYDGSGTLQHRIDAGASPSVFNETGNASADFRVESDSNQYMLFVDASANAIGINQSSPAYALDVLGGTRTTIQTMGVLTNMPNANWIEVGRWYISNAAQSSRIKITFLGAQGYGADEMGETTFVGTIDNTNDLSGYSWSNSYGTSVSKVAWKYDTDHFKIYVANAQFGAAAPVVYATGGYFEGVANDTGSTSLPAGATETHYLWQLRLGGSTTAVTSLTAAVGSLVVNEDGVDMDFRVESDTDTHAIYLDSGNNALSLLGGNAPTSNSVCIEQDLIVARTSNTPNFRHDFAGGGYKLSRSGLGPQFFARSGGAADDITKLYINDDVAWSTVDIRGGMIVNETGIDSDFRVESDTDTHALFVDASANVVGIKTSTPRTDASLTVGGTAGDGNPTLAVSAQVDGGSTFNYAFTGLITDLPNTKRAVMSIGKAEATFDTTIFGHYSASSGSSSNYGFLGMYSADDCIVWTPSKYVGIGHSSPAVRLHPYDAGGTEIIRAESGTSGTGCKIVLKTTDNGSLDKYLMQSGYWTEIGVHDNEGLRMRNSSGNITFQVTGAAGNCTISGSLSKGSGSFRIDHPLASKSATHDLVHSFVEAPQADNIYRGKVDLVSGRAIVNIDTVAGMSEGTFALLNREVQCFTSNETGWTAVRGSVDGNILTIEAQDNTCTDTISWLVIGERQDKHMYDTEWTDENGKVIVEPLKVTEADLLAKSRAYHES